MLRMIHVLAAIASGGIACAEGGFDPSSGATLQVSTTMTGIDVDLGGFRIAAGGTSTRVTPDGPANLSLPPGRYEITISELDGNCTPDGPNPVPVEIPSYTIAPQEITRVTIPVTCRAATANIDVLVHGTGRDFPIVGFAARLVGPGVNQEIAVLANRSVTFSSLAGGTYSVTLGGVPDHCTLEDDGARSVLVSVGGAQRDVQQVGFALTCQAITGDISITTRFSGVQPDLNGYLVEIDGQPAVERLLCGFYCYYYGVGEYYAVVPLRLTPTDTRLAERIAPGNRSVRLTEVAPNCTVTGEHPRTIAVALGSASETTFEVVCSQP